MFRIVIALSFLFLAAGCDNCCNTSSDCPKDNNWWVVNSSQTIAFGCKHRDCYARILLGYHYCSDKLKGFIGHSPTLDEVEKFGFFTNGADISKAPTQNGDVKFGHDVQIFLPSLCLKGNLFLRLKNGKIVWANLDKSGGWEITGAKVSQDNDKQWLEVTCPK